MSSARPHSFPYAADRIPGAVFYPVIFIPGNKAWRFIPPLGRVWGNCATFLETNKSG